MGVPYSLSSYLDHADDIHDLSPAMTDREASGEIEEKGISEPRMLGRLYLWCGSDPSTSR